MKTRCPHCHASYDIDRDLLEKSHHLVACSRCKQAFKATTGDHFLSEEKRKATETKLPAALETDVPEEMADLQAEILPAELIAPAEAPRRTGLGGWLLLILLGLLLAAQLAWLERDRLLADPKLRALAEQWCPKIGCTLPPRTRQAHYELIDRRLEPLDDHRYRLRLLLGTTDPERVPPPTLRLSLHDAQQRLIARRSLPPEEYLPADAEPLAPDHPLELTLELLVPAGGVQGYQIELLPPP